MKVIIAKHAGFCWGVQRSINLAEKAINNPEFKDKNIYSLNLLVHNNLVVDKLKEKGLKVINRLEKIDDNNVVIFSAHGVPPLEIEKAKNKNLFVIDTTCPRVKKVQIIAKNLTDKGFDVIIIGDKKHPEVKGVKKWTGKKGSIISSPKEVRVKDISLKKIGVVMQTTQDEDNVKKILAKIKKCKVKDLVVYDTICDATKKRQKAAKKLAGKVNLMLVIGDKKSANTKRLFKISKDAKVKTYFVQSEQNINKKWFEKVKCVGISAGASTPEWAIESILKKIKDINRC